MSLRPKVFELSDTEILTTYSTKPAGYELGAMATCNMNGIVGQFKFSKNKESSTAFAIGDCLYFPVLTGASFRSTASGTYATKTVALPTKYVFGGNAATYSIAKDELAGCTVQTILDTGAKQTALIVGNEAATAGSSAVTIYVGQDFATALDSTTDIQVIATDLCLQTTATTAQLVSGVAMTSVTAGYYFWRCVQSPNVLVRALGTLTATVVGCSLVPSGTAGCAEVIAASTANSLAFGNLLLAKTGTTNGDCVNAAIRTAFAY